MDENELVQNKVYDIGHHTTYTKDQTAPKPVQKNISKLSASKFNAEQAAVVDPHMTCKCQIVRSAGQWSMGLHQDEIEKSIQLAYCDMIKNSKYFIYIENQFFVSSTSGAPVTNSIAQCLADRLVQAIVQKEEHFKLIIVLPLLPGFEGEIDDKAGTVMRIQLGWLFDTIGRADKSIYKRVEDELKKLNSPTKFNPHHYIKTFGMRNHARMSGIPVTEQIYIHSKVSSQIIQSSSLSTIKSL